jgi:hypothetical protein
VRRAFRGSALVFVGSLLVAVWALPDRVPIHFGLDGEPDHWVSRLGAVALFAGIGAVMATVLGGLAHGSDRIPLTVLNVPHKRWWLADPARETRLRGLLRDDMFGVGAAVLSLLTVLVLFTIGMASSDHPSMNPWGWVVLAAWLVPFLAWLGWVYAVRYRPDE